MTKTDFHAVLKTNVNIVRAALAGDTSGHVFVWPQYWLAVRVSNDVCHAVAVDRATVVSSRDRRVFTNGHGQKAILMRREQALCNALAHAVEMLERFEANMIAA